MSHDTRADKMVPVTAVRPCPVCEKPDWCLVAPDGTAAICQRVEAGSKKKCGDAGWLHVLAERPREPRAATGGKKKATGGKLPPSHWDAEAKRFSAFLTPDTRAKLTAALGLPAGGLDCLPLVGLSPGTADTGFTTWPETDAQDSVIGINRRWKSGAKKAVAGSTRGLTLPVGWKDRPGPVLVVEGPTDAAALTAGGLSAVGTFSNGAGGKLLAELFAGWPAKRDIVVVGENDEKPDGSWPGKDGATRLAAALANALRRPVKWALTPDRAKDARAWMTHPDRGETPWPERGTEFAAKLMAGAETVNPPDPDPPASRGALPTFQVGERVSPTDRENIGTVTEAMPGHRYEVHFVGENGEVDKVFHASCLRPWPPPADGGNPAGGTVVVPAYRPFPTDALPPAVKEFVASVAASVGCDPCFAALPALALVGAAVGGALVARPKRGWNEVPVLWAVVVGDSGTAKSPAADPVSAVAHAIEDGLEEEYERAVEKFREDVAAYRAKMDAREEGDPSDPPAKPVPPARVYFTADDITIERLIENLRSSPRGILMLQDELANWFGSFGRYKGKAGGSDSAKWLGMFDGRPVGYQRKTASPGTPRDVRVKRAIVGVSGGIQPGILADALSNPAYLNSGLAARLVFAMPPKRCVRWTDAEPDADADARFRRVVHALRELPFDPKAAVPWVGLSVAARAAFAAFHDDMAEAAEGHDGGGMAAAVPKLVRVGLRLALIHHCATEADAGRDPGRESIPESSMRAGIELAKWFEAEAERVYAMLAEKPEDRAVRRLAEWVARQGGRATARELMRSNRKFKTTAEAEAALDALVSAGLGQWEDSPATGGRPANRAFVLGSCPDADGRQKPTEPADGGEEEPDPDDGDSHPRADKRPAGRQNPAANPLETSDSDGVSAFVGCRPDTTIPTDGATPDPTDPPSPARTRREYVPDPLCGETGRGGGR